MHIGIYLVDGEFQYGDWVMEKNSPVWRNLQPNMTSGLNCVGFDAHGLVGFYTTNCTEKDEYVCEQILFK